MSDLIDRQQAIDAMAELQGRASTKAELKGISKAWKRIKQLPSAESDVPDTNVGDMISRQAAIDICNHAVESFTGQFGAGVLIAIRDDIEQLPSAETDIIRCEDCEYYGSRRWCELHSSVFDDNAFCSYGERRQDG